MNTRTAEAQSVKLTRPAFLPLPLGEGQGERGWIRKSPARASSAIISPSSQNRCWGRSVPCALLALVSLLLLGGAWGSFAAASKFAEVPSFLLQPATNVSEEISPASTNAPSNAAGSSAKGGTNVAAATGTNSMEALDDKHLLAIGDRLSFRIVEDEEDPKPLLVTDSGDLEVPYIGRFPAVGKTCKALARELKTELEKEYYYHATVIVAVDVMTRSRGKVYLVGPVRAPGPQDIPSDEVFTLSKAILRAGGFGDFANKHDVKVTRKSANGKGEEQTFVIDVAEILEKGKTDKDLTLEPGDFVYIPERSVRLY